jgi:hypothetical protein
MTSEAPLIHTSKGNLPVADLRLEILWDDQPDYVKFVERFWLGEELVKESAHVYSRVGFDLASEQGTF